ncbi:immunity 41 family protein [Moraxella nasovis]|uniref:Imm41 family immunity protein n=1 Tax=Moraxella nasovis TaxID=2904121 RepID=UPI001F60E09B|nr:Imm41 family immunity protein [Moraxella nasovis]UNU73316.1 immunity 41 family protein [Moraxella nasovis]
MKENSDFLDFYRNITFSDNYDVNSFIGKWIDDAIWSDEEYIKLEKSLLTIQKAYPYPTDIPREIIISLYRIIELMMIPNWLDFDVEKSNLNDESDIFDRFERLKLVISYVLSGNDIQEIGFGYNP